MANVSAAPPATETNPLSSIFRPAILLPVLVVLGYAAFVVAGFGDGLGNAQPLPLYVYIAILLIVLQISLSSFRSILRSLYGIAAALFGLVFAAEASFFPNSPSNFTRAPLTYVIVNIVAVIVFAVDAIQRTVSSGSTSGPAPQTAASLRFYRILATDFAGLSILFFISSFLLDFINTRSALRFLGVQPPSKPISVDLNSLFGFHLPSTIEHLEGLNLALAFVTAVIWLLLIVVIGALSNIGGQSAGTPSQPAQQVSPFIALFLALGDIIRRGFLEATYSLRSVLQIFLWLIPSFSIANFATTATDFFNAAARAQVNIANLFNPFSTSSLNNYQLGLADLVLAVIALVAVVATVAVAEFDINVIRKMLLYVGTFGRILSLTLIFFTLALAVTNAASIQFGIDKATPFQVGAATVVALVLLAGNALYSAVVVPSLTKSRGAG
jgi:hypothetical protein